MKTIIFLLGKVLQNAVGKCGPMQEARRGGSDFDVRRGAMGGENPRNNARSGEVRVTVRVLQGFLGFLACFACAGAVFAEAADRDRPMNIEADAMRHDDLQQVSVFSGRVVMTKGSIIIRGDRLEVRQDREGYQHGLVTTEGGRRSFFRQKRNPPREGQSRGEEFIEGEAHSIAYDGRTDSVTLTGDARLRRLRDTVLSDEITGAVIHYDNITDVFTVNGPHAAAGGTDAGSAAKSSAGRVRATMMPNAASDAQHDGAAGGATTALQPSPRLSHGAIQ